MSSIRFRLIDDVMEARDGTMIRIKRAIPCDPSHPDAYDPLLYEVDKIQEEYHWLDVIGTNTPHVEIIGDSPLNSYRRVPVSQRARVTNPGAAKNDATADKKENAQVTATATTPVTQNGVTQKSRVVSASFEEPKTKASRNYNQSQPEKDEIRFYKDKVVTIVQLKRNIDKNLYYMVIDPGNGEDIQVKMTEANWNQLKEPFIKARDADKEANGEYKPGERFGLAVKVVQGQGRAMKFRNPTETENGSVSEESPENEEVI